MVRASTGQGAIVPGSPSSGPTASMMSAMTDRGLPIVDGAPACPFVAFDDDRDARATSPDHRHRCYAEIRPAPRALAHQEAYCLSSAFAVCPTFQDWARREAAKATAAASTAAPIVTGVEPGATPTDRPSFRAADQDEDEDLPRRNPPREWSAPPPWVGPDRDAEDQEEAPDDERDIGPLAGAGGGLAGSFADRLANPGSAAADEPVWHDSPPGTVTEPTPSAYGGPRYEDLPARPSRPARGSATLPPAPRSRDSEPLEAGPHWERPRRREAYPTIRTRMGLGRITVPSVLIGLAAVLIAAVALFFLPALLGIGNPPATPAPTGSAAPSGSAGPSAESSPTDVPQPTQQIYVVQQGDTMSRIANRFGVPLQTLIDANKATIPDPNKIKIGDQVIIPAAAPTTLPGVEASPSP